jgi:hypothetical protein
MLPAQPHVTAADMPATVAGSIAVPCELLAVMRQWENKSGIGFILHVFPCFAL